MRLALPAPRDGSLLLGFRGEDVRLAPAGEGIAFTVKVAEPMGSHLLLTGSIAERHIRIVAPPATKAQAGDRLGLVPDPTRVVWMAPDTGTLVGVA